MSFTFIYWQVILLLLGREPVWHLTETETQFSKEWTVSSDWDLWEFNQFRVPVSGMVETDTNETADRHLYSNVNPFETNWSQEVIHFNGLFKTLPWPLPWKSLWDLRSFPVLYKSAFLWFVITYCATKLKWPKTSAAFVSHWKVVL